MKRNSSCHFWMFTIYQEQQTCSSEHFWWLRKIAASRTDTQGMNSINCPPCAKMWTGKGRAMEQNIAKLRLHRSWTQAFSDAKLFALHEFVALLFVALVYALLFFFFLSLSLLFLSLILLVFFFSLFHFPKRVFCVAQDWLVGPAGVLDSRAIAALTMLCTYDTRLIYRYIQCINV